MSARLGHMVWQRAVDLVGARFRLQGRDPATGLDCVGVVIAAYAGAGVRLNAIDHYRLRSMQLDQVRAGLETSGLVRCDHRQLAAGDVGLFTLERGQFHLALLAADRLVHADANLRRVALAPLSRLPAPIGRWRSEASMED